MAICTVARPQLQKLSGRPCRSSIGLFSWPAIIEGGDEEYKHPVSPAVTDRFTGFSAIPLFHAALYSQYDLGVERG